ncbi:hypothetical protein PFISCL1PPCAC_22313, partial [Pristionchus fissidentatus]
VHKLPFRLSCQVLSYNTGSFCSTKSCDMKSRSKDIDEIMVKWSENELIEKQNLHFPILDLPAELSSKILSYMGPKELSICLKSLTLDRVYADLSKDWKIPFMRIQIDGSKAFIYSERYYGDSEYCNSSLPQICERFRLVLNNCEFGILTLCLFNACDESELSEFIDLLKGVRCTNLLYIHSFRHDYPRVLTISSLRELMHNKKMVEIGMLCEGVTATGLFTLWKDLLDGIFERLTIIVGKKVMADFFKLLPSDGKSRIKRHVHTVETGGNNGSIDIYEVRSGILYEDRKFVRVHFILLRKE